MRPKPSCDRRPRNAGARPSRPSVRAVLNGPPPGCASIRPSWPTTRSISASPTTVIIGGLAHSRPAASRPQPKRSTSDQRLQRRPCPALVQRGQRGLIGGDEALVVGQVPEYV